MSKHDDEVSLRHMLEHAREAVTFVTGKDHSDLEASRILSLALVRLIEIVGEAANRVSKTRQKQLSQISWLLVIGMRNRLIHGYDAVDLDIVWQTVTEELPSLITILEAIVPQRDS
jgi:uncharacterized protein with HEPN domain